MKQYEAKDNKTGNTIWINENELSNYGLSAPQPEDKRNVAQKVIDFVAPTTRKTIEKGMSGDLELQKRRKQDVEDIKTKGNLVGDLAKYTAHSFQEMNPLVGLFNKDYRKEVAAPGAEIASWVMPNSKVFKATEGASKGAKFATGVGNVLATGAQSGALSAAGNPETQNLQDMFTGALTGAATSGVLSGFGELSKAAFKTLTKSMPVGLTQRSLKVKDKKVAENIVKEGIGGSYEKIIQQSDDIKEAADKAFDKLDKPKISIDKILGDTPDVQMDSLNIMLDYSKQLENNTPEKKKLMGILGDLLDNNELSVQDADKLKQFAASPVYSAAGNAKNSVKADDLKGVADRIRAELRLDDDVAKLLDTKQAAIVASAGAKIASGKSPMEAIPNILEISSLLTVPYGYTAPAAAFIINRTLKNPRISNVLSTAGSKTEKLMNKKSIEALRKFLYRGSQIGASKTMTE